MAKFGRARPHGRRRGRHRVGDGRGRPAQRIRAVEVQRVEPLVRRRAEHQPRVAPRRSTPSRNRQDVAGVAALNAYALSVKGRPNLAIAAATDGRFGGVVDRARLIKGRRADPAAADEITIGESLASQLHLGVGDHLDADSVTPAQFQELVRGHDPGPPAGPHLRLKIVGIARRPLDLGDRATVGGVVILTPAFDRQYADQIQVWSEVLASPDAARDSRRRTRHRHRPPDVLRPGQLQGAGPLDRDAGRRRARSTCWRVRCGSSPPSSRWPAPSSSASSSPASSRA